MIKLTNRQARQFLMVKHGLPGRHKFSGKDGAMEFIRQAGCIQYDPIDICGRNAELTLQSRVRGFKKPMLAQLLYKDRLLVDFPDKNTAIIPAADWVYFGRKRAAARKRAEEHPELLSLMEQTLAFIDKSGVVSPDDLTLDSGFKWRAYIVWSSGKNLSSSVMEQLYGCGELVIHHKKGARKYYDLASRHIPAEVLSAPEPLTDDFEYNKWYLLRRIGAIGLFPNRRPPSELCINLSQTERGEILNALLNECKIIEVSVEGQKHCFHCLSEDMPLLENVLSGMSLPAACELLAPLDPLMWDRKLIKDIFNFHYTWEIYTPVEKRKYGHYVLPLIYGDSFIGRVEAVNDAKTGTLVIKNIWFEDGVRRTKKFDSALDSCIKRFARFNECGDVCYETLPPVT